MCGPFTPGGRMACLCKNKIKHSPLTLPTRPSTRVPEPFHAAQRLLLAEKEPLPTACNTTKTSFLWSAMVNVRFGITEVTVIQSCTTVKAGLAATNSLTGSK